jgi:hypothetical protein
MPNKKTNLRHIKKVIAANANLLNKRNGFYQLMLINTEYEKFHREKVKLCFMCQAILSVFCGKHATQFIFVIQNQQAR